MAYRFKCEHCGTTTDWLPAQISFSQTVQVGMFQKEQERARFQQEFWRTYPERCKAIEGGNYSNVTGLKFDCPSCGKSQSWGMKTTSPGTLIFGAIVMLGLAMLWFVVSNNGIHNLGGLVVAGLALVGTIGCPVCIGMAISEAAKQSKIKEAMSTTTERNKPEFDFPPHK